MHFESLLDLRGSLLCLRKPHAQQHKIADDSISYHAVLLIKFSGIDRIKALNSNLTPELTGRRESAQY
jgi:hypothetical protein